MTIALSRVSWLPCWRIIPSRFPPIDLFERIADPADWDALIELESLTNDRIRNDVGDISLVPVEERVAGPGASVIMAAFTHPNPEGSRFTDGSYGLFYASREFETAVAETRHHRERFMRATAQSRIDLDMRVYLLDLEGDLHDIRGRRREMPTIYHTESYAGSQHLAKTLRAEDSSGIAYDSVRHDGGECAAVFRPRLLGNVRQERHLCYVWDGARIKDVYEKRVLT